MGKEKEKEPKHYIDKEYPNWAWVNYKVQDASFLKDVRDS
jgi:hypothetical protein